MLLHIEIAFRVSTREAANNLFLELMYTRCKFVGLLTSNQLSLLKSLYELKKQAPNNHWRPKDLGAYRWSHHTTTLASMERNGWVEKIAVQKGTRAQYAYRITDKGVVTLDVFKELVEVPTAAVLGGEVDRNRAQMATRLLLAPVV